jgi:hypothetical protein
MVFAIHGIKGLKVIVEEILKRFGRLETLQSRRCQFGGETVMITVDSVFGWCSWLLWLF